MNAIILSQICSTRDKNLRRVAEYPSLEKAIAAYDSPAYAEAFKALGDGAVRDSRIIEELGWDYHLTRNATAPARFR